MEKERIQRATSDDGTEIAGRIRGQGPPLVLVHGSLEDGDLVWASLLPFLSERFTCYLMSTRGRGLSGDHPDLSPDRLVEDVTAFVESIGEPVRLLGESAGGMLALGAAARSAAVSAVAVYEPTVFDVLGEEDGARLQEVIARVADAAAEGKLADGARMFAEALVNEDEMTALSSSSYFTDSARYVPILLREIDHSSRAEGPGPTDPSVLARIRAPVLLLSGARTVLHTFFKDGIRHVSDHVRDSRAREIADAGHWGPVLRPEPIAGELVPFFDAAKAA